MEREDFYTTVQAAQRLHIKPATLARKLSERKLAGVKVGRQWLIKRKLWTLCLSHKRHRVKWEESPESGRHRSPVAIAQKKPLQKRNPMHDAPPSYPAPPWEQPLHL